MPRPEKLTVAEALAQAQLIDATLAAWDETAPEFVASLGGRDAIARDCEMTCVGPMPHLDVESWQRACLEWWERTDNEARSRSVLTSPVQPGAAVDEPPPAAKQLRRRGLWGIFTR